MRFSSASNPNPHRLLGIILGVTAAFAAFTTIQFSQSGRWLPAPPDQIGGWSATDMPLSESARDMLGGAPTESRRYSNPFNEQVEAHLIATASFDAYHEPEMCRPGNSFGFSLTAEKRIPLFGPGKYVRAMILKNGIDGQRVLMYYWLQYPDGRTSTRGDMTDYREIYPRLTVGFFTLLEGEQCCIVRAYTQIHPADNLGVQARRNLNEVAQGIYKSSLHNPGIAVENAK